MYPYNEKCLSNLHSLALLHHLHQLPRVWGRKTSLGPGGQDAGGFQMGLVLPARSACEITGAKRGDGIALSRILVALAIPNSESTIPANSNQQHNITHHQHQPLHHHFQPPMYSTRVVRKTQAQHPSTYTYIVGARRRWSRLSAHGQASQGQSQGQSHGCWMMITKARVLCGGIQQIFDAKGLTIGLLRLAVLGANTDMVFRRRTIGHREMAT